MLHHETASFGSIYAAGQEALIHLQYKCVCQSSRVAKQKACYSVIFDVLHAIYLLQDARPWPNYDTDYRPMVEVAKNEGLPVICANAPRRYVSLAGRSGREALEQLPQEARQWLAPLPYRQPSQVHTGCRFYLPCIPCLNTDCCSTRFHERSDVLADMPSR